MTRGSKNPLWYRVPERVAELRRQSALTKRALGERAGLSDVTIGKYDAGVVVPSVEHIERIAAALGVPPCWLAFGDLGEEQFQQKRSSSTPIPPTPEPVLGGLPYRALHEGCPDRLRDRREQLALSYRDLGASAGCSYEAIRKTEARKTVPKLDVVHRLAVALGVSPCWLAFGVGQGPKES